MRAFVAAAILGFMPVVAQAALVGRLPLTPGGTDYQAYFDTDLNITWLADANYPAIEPLESVPATGCYHQGSMCSYTAVGFDGSGGWIGQLNARNFLGINTWRLPRTLQPDPTCSRTIPEGSAGYYCTGSELGHMFYEELGGAAGQVPLSEVHGANYLLFPSLQPHDYWTECTVTGYCGFGGGYGTNVWAYNMSLGFQGILNPGNIAFVWPVTGGDAFAPVPIPPAAWLFGSALGVIGIVRRKRCQAV